MAIKNCTQTKCIYLLDNSLCPECSECGTQAHKINENCVNCWNCLKDEGYIRKGLNEQQKQAIKIRVEARII